MKNNIHKDSVRIMKTERFRHLPIVDQDTKLVNMMSQRDFISKLNDNTRDNYCRGILSTISLFRHVR